MIRYFLEDGQSDFAQNGNVRSLVKCYGCP